MGKVADEAYLVGFLRRVCANKRSVGVDTTSVTGLKEWMSVRANRRVILYVVKWIIIKVIRQNTRAVLVCGLSVHQPWTFLGAWIVASGFHDGNPEEIGGHAVHK